MNRLKTEGLRTICGGPFSFALERSECTALSGPSGCGKTLLLRAIADLDPAEGTVLLDGEDRSEMSAPLWRNRVGWLPAESSWWADHVGDHFFRRRGFQPRLHELCASKEPFPRRMIPVRKFDADSLCQRGWKPLLPFPTIGRSALDARAMTTAKIASTLGRLGFEKDVLEWKVERLSTGEKQRLALFRLLLNEPQVLLLDEPTAALDHANVHLAEEVIAEYRRSSGAAVLWVSHDPEQIARAAERHLQFVGGALEEMQ